MSNIRSVKIEKELSAGNEFNAEDMLIHIPSSKDNTPLLYVLGRHYSKTKIGGTMRTLIETILLVIALWQNEQELLKKEIYENKGR